MFARGAFIQFQGSGNFCLPNLKVGQHLNSRQVKSYELFTIYLPKQQENAFIVLHYFIEVSSFVVVSHEDLEYSVLLKHSINVYIFAVIHFTSI